MRSLIALTAAAASAAPALAQTPTFNDVVYATVLRDDGAPMPVRLDVYWNNNTAPASPSPCVVWIHGGGWRQGTHDGLPTFVRQLLARGVVVASVEYRLSGEAIFPAQIHDVKGAIRHLKRNAGTYRIDPARIGAWGSSAGGHLSALLLLSNNNFAAEGVVGGGGLPRATIRAAVDYFGPSDIINMNPDVTTPPGSAIDHDAPDSPESRLIGYDGPNEGVGVLRANQNNPNPPFPALMNLITLASPLAHVDPRDLRLFIAHGLNDVVVPLKQSTKLFDALQAVGADPVLLEVADAGHGALGVQTDAAAQDFLIAELTRCLPDLNRDDVVDDADFVRFALSYNALFDARADFNGDGLADDADFVIFATAYNQLSCP